MTAADEIAALLDSYGPPAPTLLPWLARWAAADDLPEIARAAAAQAPLAPLRRWPAVADAVAETLAERMADQPATVAALAALLPQLAAHLNHAQAAALLASGPRAEVFGYAALADRSADFMREAAFRLPEAPWRQILSAARNASGALVPPLANLRLLARLTSGWPILPDVLPGSEAAYLLPYLTGASGQGILTPGGLRELAEEILEEIEEYLPYHPQEATSWYAAALSARVLPFLDAVQRLRLGAAADAAPPPWAAVLRYLAGRRPERWPSVAAEIAAAHPVVALLSEIADRAEPGELTAPCADLARQIMRGYGDSDLERWEPAGSPTGDEVARVITRSPGRVAPVQVPLGTPDDLHPVAPPVRFLVGECPETTSVGRPLRLRAWVAQAAAGRGIALLPFDVPAQGRDVLLVLTAPPGMRVLTDSTQRLHVPLSGDSDYGEFSLQADAPGRYPVSVFAFLDGTHLGTLTVSVSVERDAPPGPDRRVRGNIGMEPVRDAVTLIAQYAPRERVYRFQLVADDYPSAVRYELDFDPSESVNGLIQTLNDLAQGRRSFDAEGADYFLTNKGAQLWRDLLPERLREQFWDHQGAIAQLTILGDKDIIPWEVLYPKDRGRKSSGFLVDQFPVMRAMFDRSQARSLRLRPARFVLPPRSPSRAADEVQTLREILREGSADAVISEYSQLMRLLRNDDFGVLHFACHNTFDPATGSAIKFDKNIFSDDVLTMLAEERGLAESAPIVFINACRAAGVALSYNKLEGWATQFMEAGAGAFIGSLWEVTDETSTQFAAEIYRQLGVGATLGAAVLAARKSISQSPADPTWLAYTVYGDARATINQPRGGQE